MYQVSADFTTASHQPIQRWNVRGTIGSTAFTSDNILQGSLQLSNQCSASSDITLGAVYIGQMTCTFVDVSISRTQWQNKDITIEIGLQLADNTTEWIPFGVYHVAEVEHTAVGVNVTAYDNMRKFDKAFTLTEIQANTPHSLIQYACTTCGVTLANASLTGFCNADQIMPMHTAENIETYRDFISWVCQAVVGFATINRQGELEIRRFVQTTAVDTIDYTDRFSNSAFADYSTHYTGVALTKIDDNTIDYYGATVDDGTPIKLGANPFLQNTDVCVRNILTEIQSIAYIPFKASLIGGAQFDLGDMLTQTNGVAGTTASCLVMSYDYRFGNSYTMQGYGANPQLATAKSKSDKQIEALLSKVQVDSLQYVEYTNTEQVVIGSTKDRIIRLRYATAKDTILQFHAELRLTATCDSTETANDVTVDDCVAVITYEDNNTELAIHPTETYFDGKHTLHLLWAIHASAGALAYFDVFMICNGGTITMDAGDISAYICGTGLVGDTAWDGLLEITDTFDVVPLPQMTIRNYADTVSKATQTPPTTALTDAYATITTNIIQIANYTDNVAITEE